MRPIKVFIIDDEPLTCQLIAKVLELNGFQAVSAIESKNWSTLIPAENPDLILLDYYLGAKSGLELFQSLREDPSTAAIPVIMSSGIDRHKQVIEAGADGFLQKPFNWNQLVALIQELVPQANHAVT